MADLLFNASDPASCAATLRLLREDKLYFKQVGWRTAQACKASWRHRFHDAALCGLLLLRP
jgi:hypothetical protein